MYAEECAGRHTVLFLVKGLDAVTCRFVVPELRFVFAFVEFRLFVPLFAFENID